MFEKSWKCGKDLFTCFVDLEKHNIIAFLILQGSAKEWHERSVVTYIQLINLKLLSKFHVARPNRS